MKKKVGFYCCSNGYGHFRRVIEIAELLVDFYDVEIICSSEQIKKFKKINKVKYTVSSQDNINWEKALNTPQEVIADYFNWVKLYGPYTHKHDIVVSDNLPGLLEYRSDTILLGSFLWKDVFNTLLGDNELSTYDSKLIARYKPIILTNKYVETQSVKVYNNKIQFGFGCKDRRSVFSKIKYNLVNKSSLKYLDSYSKFISKLSNDLNFTDNFSHNDSTIMFARPGVGTITHCVENYIPLVALYDEKDSQEIIELAQTVEDLSLGFKQNVNEKFNTVKYKMWGNNSSILYGPKLELDGYTKIANFIKQYES